MQSPYRKLGVGASISTEILISDVVIARMLMPLLGQRLEGVGGDAGMAAHADADDRDLGDVGRALTVW
jgi:hypothetical protein